MDYVKRVEQVSDRVQTTALINGITLPFGWAKRRVYGGSYLHKPSAMYGVLLAPEIDMVESHLFLPIRDFSIPTNRRQVDEVVLTVLTALAFNDVPVYIGCRGGMGRTGLLLGILAKTMGVRDPINFVRQHYHPMAIETRLQERYVEAYPSPLHWAHGWKLKATAVARDMVRRSQD